MRHRKLSKVKKNSSKLADKKIRFRIDGKEIGDNYDYNTEALISYINNMPLGELKSIKKLSEELGYEQVLFRQVVYSKLSSYIVKIRNRLYIGSKETTEAYNGYQNRR